MKKYTKEELSLIWLDSFVGLEYKHKAQIYEYLTQSEKISEGLDKAKDYIVSNVGENEYKTMLGSANQTYLNFVLEELDRKKDVEISLLKAAIEHMKAEIEKLKAQLEKNKLIGPAPKTAGKKPLKK